MSYGIAMTRRLCACCGSLLGVLVSAPSILPAAAAELPVPCVAGVCAGVSGFVTSGSAGAASSGNTLTITQNTDSAILNWQSFNLSRDGRVQFIQPDSSSTALNRIFQNSASQIFGSIQANGRIYLLNQNGFVFGEGAAINVSGLLATSLDMTPEAVSGGLLAPGRNGNAALRLYTDGSGQALDSGAVEVQAGATLRTGEGGSVYMFAPEIRNAGQISTPGGQTLLAAGSPVYLVSSADPNLRGLMVEVGTGGTLTNGIAANAGATDPGRLVGQIVAERGNVTLAGLAVNQLGRVSATTSISQNGSIYLQARDGGSAQDAALIAGKGGNLTLGAASVTDVQLAASTDSTVDATTQPHSRVELDANRIVLARNSRIIAPHGDVSLIARAQSEDQPGSFAAGLDVDSRIYLAPGATIDVSGAGIERSVSSNVLTVELRGTELADSPMQRDGVLRGRSVQIDTRLSGTRADGSTWVGSPIGDLSGWVAAAKRDVSERNLNGGSVQMYSQGDVILADGSTVDVSGGSIRYTDGYVNTTAFLGADGKVYDIGAADRDIPYAGIAGAGSMTLSNPRWGVAETYRTQGQQGRFEAGYVEGKDAGAIAISGQRVILDGELLGNVEAGRYQREKPASPNATALYRAYDQLPLGGSLTFGNALTPISGASQDKDFQLASLRVIAGSAPDQLSGFTATTQLVAGAGETLLLREHTLEQGGFASLVVRANGTVELPASMQLDMPDFGNVDVRAGEVDIAGGIVAPGGRIALTATRTIDSAPLEGGLNIRGNAVLDVAGRWVNDLPLANGGLAGGEIAVRNGGSISLAGENQELHVATGALLDVSGGARLTARNRLNAGTGGSLSFTTVPVPETGVTPALQLDGTLVGAALSKGGALSITTGALCIAGDADQCRQQSPDGLLVLSPDTFAHGGFSSFALRSNLGGVEIAAGTDVELSARNLLALQPLGDRPSGGKLADFLALGALPPEQRGAVDFSVTVAPVSIGGEGFGAGNFPSTGSLVVGAGAAVRGETGARVTLNSSTRLLVDGTLSAPSGTVALKLDNTLPISGADQDGYFASQGIWLGDHAVLDASAATRIVTSDQGLRSGEVLAGGSILINAQRGHVLTSRGSRMDVSGTSAELDLRSDARGGFERTTVASAAGVVDVSAAEAIVLGGTMEAHSGSPGTVRGGELRLTLDPNLRLDTAQFVETPYSRFPDQDRTIELLQQGGGHVFGTQDLPALFQGRALLGSNQIEDAGFDAAVLTARSFTVRDGSQQTHLGRILLGAGVDLSLDGSLTLDAAVLASNGGTASLSAPSLTLGHGDSLLQDLAPLQNGLGRLRLSAQQLDVRGSSVLQGFADARLQATGDLRLIGTVPQSGSSFNGFLGTGGSLELSANQIYPTTLSQFTVAAGALDGGTLTISRPASVFTADALSAGGQLRLVAPRVVQQGTLRAPFGSITVDAPDIDLGSGGVTSTSGAGLSMLFGSTQGGFDWVYSIGNNYTQVFGDGHAALPAQRITLDGEQVRVREGAVLDSRGGGSLLATEFIPGTTGTVDVLADAAAAGAFAVLPSAALSAIPHDPQISIDSVVHPGTSVHLAGVAGVLEGDYLVLPARYALLPGALLVKPVSGYADITGGEQYAQRDGSTIVSGYFLNSGTTLRDPRRSGFAVTTAGTLASRARYAVTSADTFFSEQADAAGVQAGRMPRDAGTVAILANSSLVLDGRLRGDVAAGGRGVALDIASDRITVTADGSGAFDGLVLSAADLRGFGAESLLLGGTRSDSVDGNVAINTISRSMTVADGAQLQGRELLLVAKDKLEIQGGGEVISAGAAVATRDLALEGDGALLRVARGDTVSVERDNAAGVTGDLLIRDGALLRAPDGAINMESTRGALLAGSIAAEGGSLAITGNLISLGDAPDSAAGFVLSNAQLQGLGLDSIQLRSRNSIDLYGQAGSALNVLSGGDVDLQARALRAMGGNVLIDVTGRLGLRGESSATLAVTADDTAPRLEIRAGNVAFDGGALGIEGFSATSLRAAGELRAAQDSALATAGDLSMTGTRLSGASGVDLSVSAQGLLAFTGNGGTPTTDADDLGASISLAGESVRIGGSITLHSGSLNIAANAGGVTLESDARIDVSGREVTYVDAPAFSAGGLFSVNAADFVQLRAGSRVDVSGAADAAAGRISLRSQDGGLQLATGSLKAGGAQGSGDLLVEAQSMPALDAVAAEWKSGGFSGELSVRQKGAGGLSLGAGSMIRGTGIEIVADHGGVSIAGTLRAAASAGGRIRVTARDGIEIGGALDARPGIASDRNGRIELEMTDGGLRTLSGARISTTASVAAGGSAADGQVHIRLSRATLQNLLDVDAGNDSVRLQGDWSQTGGTIVEGFKAYDITDGSLSAADVLGTVNPLFAETAAFAAQSASLVSTLNSGSVPGLQVRPGIELRSAGDLALDANWDLTAWRLSQQPGTLTLRAGGNLTFNRSLSDGFTGLTGANSFNLARTTESWSYRLVGGADLTSTDVLATQSSPAAGNVHVTAGDPAATAGYRMIRTGTGSIDVRAAGDIELGNSASMIYTAGTARVGTAFSDLGELGSRRYPVNGGDITLTAGRDIRGADSGQLVTDWLWRVGNIDLGSNARSTAWTVAFSNFRQNVGALGGGDITVRAGGNVDTLSASAPTIGFQSGGIDPATSQLEVTGRGSVDIRAAGNVLGGNFYAGRGTVHVAAGDSIGVSSQTAMAPVVALGDASATLLARRDLSLQAVVNPTLLPQGVSQAALGSGASLFSTYSPASRVALRSVAGDVKLLPAVDLVPVLTSMNLDGSSVTGLQLYPGTLEADALRGDVELNGSLTLSPAADGRMSLRAMDDVRIASATTVIVSDVALANIPTAQAPRAGWTDDLAGVLVSTGTGSPALNAAVPVRQAAAEAGTLQRTQLIAQTGDVDQQGASGSQSLLHAGGPVLVYAGRDVRDLNLVAQNLTAGDVTKIEAGRDIRYSIQRAPLGSIATNAGQITVDGPGFVTLKAGRDINFQNSAGVTTRGSLVNNALADSGASIGLLAGLNGIEPEYEAFAQKYIQDSDTHGAALIDFLAVVDGDSPADLMAARDRFEALDPDLQQRFLQQVLLVELRTSGRNAASADPELKDDYSAGFAALETLFPGANPDKEAGETNPYEGNVALYFSRIYTLAGGDISLLAPGGEVNAGLSTPPSAFGVPKQPSQLGIVAQSRGNIGVLTNADLQVNESRVFSADGGDILVWSTGGDIDAGRGAKTAVSAPPPIITIDENGRLSVSFPAALTGSGIQTLATSSGVKPGNVDLFAPRGVVNAGDAGIVAGNLTIGATAVLGADNIKVSGVAVGVPVDAGGLGASLQGVSSQASSASSAMDAGTTAESGQQQAAAVAEDALTWLEVFVTGFGEEGCRPDDNECLMRERQKQ